MKSDESRKEILHSFRPSDGIPRELVDHHGQVIVALIPVRRGGKSIVLVCLQAGAKIRKKRS